MSARRPGRCCSCARWAGPSVARSWVRCWRCASMRDWPRPGCRPSISAHCVGVGAATANLMQARAALASGVCAGVRGLRGFADGRRGDCGGDEGCAAALWHDGVARDRALGLFDAEPDASARIPATERHPSLEEGLVKIPQEVVPQFDLEGRVILQERTQHVGLRSTRALPPANSAGIRTGRRCRGNARRRRI